jgi:hypothetical protein
MVSKKKPFFVQRARTKKKEMVIHENSWLTRTRESPPSHRHLGQPHLRQPIASRYLSGAPLPGSTPARAQHSLCSIKRRRARNMAGAGDDAGMDAVQKRLMFEDE